MTKVTFIEPSGSEKVVDARDGSSLMEAATHNNVRGITADCGGACTCATCHVYVDAAWMEAVGAPGELEEEMLTLAIDPQPNSRLSCQIKVTESLEGLIVQVPASQF